MLEFDDGLDERDNNTYKAKWQIPKLILKAYTINFKTVNYISTF